jgi:hypothetical protein
MAYSVEPTSTWFCSRRSLRPRSALDPGLAVARSTVCRVAQRIQVDPPDRRQSLWAGIGAGVVNIPRLSCADPTPNNPLRLRVPGRVARERPRRAGMHRGRSLADDEVCPEGRASGLGAGRMHRSPMLTAAPPSWHRFTHHTPAAHPVPVCSAGTCPRAPLTRLSDAWITMRSV